MNGRGGGWRREGGEAAERNINLRGGKRADRRTGGLEGEEISFPNSELESTAIITALRPSIVCPGKSRAQRSRFQFIFIEAIVSILVGGVKRGRYGLGAAEEKEIRDGGKCSGTGDGEEKHEKDPPNHSSPRIDCWRREDEAKEEKEKPPWHFCIGCACTLWSPLWCRR